MRYFFCTQRALQKCANGQRAFVMCNFCDPFPMYSLNIRCIRTYTSRKSICLPVLSFTFFYAIWWSPKMAGHHVIFCAIKNLPWQQGDNAIARGRSCNPGKGMHTREQARKQFLLFLCCCLGGGVSQSGRLFPYAQAVMLYVLKGLCTAQRLVPEACQPPSLSDQPAPGLF